MTKASAYAWMTVEPPKPRADATNAHYPGEFEGAERSGRGAALGESLGIPRDVMPQISSEHVPEFLGGLRAQGVKVTSGESRVGDLRATQSELNVEKAESMLHGMDDSALSKPIIVSNDGYVMDGHHRWAALRLRSHAAKIQTHVVDLPISELLAAANKFPKVTRKTVNDARRLEVQK